MTDQERTRRDTSSAIDRSSLERRWGHPLLGFLRGVGFWLANAVVAIGVVVATLLTLLEEQVQGGWAIVAPAALIVFGLAVLFAFAGWIARSSR